MASEDAPIDDATKVVATLSTMVASAGDTPEAKEAARNLGRAAVTLTQTVNTMLLPLAAVNFAVDKARNYFNGKFEADLKEASKHIPDEDLREPKAYIAAPVLQGLAFAHEEDELRRLYLALLASAMDGRAQSVCHPAFSDILKQLSPFEAELASELLSADGNRPIITITIKTSTGFRELHRHILPLTVDGVHTSNPNVPIFVTNLMRLGLVEVDYTHWISDPTAYEWATSRPEYVEALKRPLAEGESIDKKHGVFRRTSFGGQFAAAVGIETIPR